MTDSGAGSIVPGRAIGKLRLGMSRAEVRGALGADANLVPSAERVCQIGDVRVWFDPESGTVDQLLVEEGFPGQIAEGAGMGLAIGSRLREVADKLGPWREVDDMHYFQRSPFTGFCFDELDRDEDDTSPYFDEMEYQVINIVVFSPGPGTAPSGNWEEWLFSLPERQPMRNRP